jgi:hypothetical protein
MDDKYQCHICMELANKPVVTPCGHLFWYLIVITVVGRAYITGSGQINSI